MKGSKALFPTFLALAILGGAVSVQGTALAKKQVTLKFWHFFGGTRLTMMNEIIADFQKKYPDIKVQASFVDEPSRHNKLLAAVAAGTPPDLTMLGRQDIPSYVLRRVLRPLDAYMKRDNITKSDFYPSEFGHCIYQGKTWIVPCPVGGAQNMLFYNKDHFREAGLDPKNPPKTWAELEVHSKKLVVQGANGTAKRVGFMPISWVAPQWQLPYVYSNGGTWLDPTGRKITLDSPQSVEAFRWLSEFQKRTYGTIKLSSYAFEKGTQSMEAQGSWHMFELKAAGFKGDYGIAPLPYNNGGKSHGVIVGGWGYIIPGNTKYPDESWKLLQYMSVGEGARKFYRTQMRPAPVRAINKDPYFKANLDEWDNILDIMENDVAIPITPAALDLDRIFSTYYGVLLSGKRSPEVTVKMMTDEAQKALDIAWKRMDARK